MQTHWVEKVMPYANYTRILDMKGVLHETDPVSRRFDFLPAANLYMSNESLLWDENVPHIGTIGNDPTTFALSTLEALRDDNYFLSKLKGTCSSCSYFSDENTERGKGRKFEKLCDGLLRYHHRVVNPHPATTLTKA